MNPAEIVVHVVDRNRVLVILDLLRKCVSQAGETAHPQSHREVLALANAGGNMLVLWLADDLGLATTHANGGRANKRPDFIALNALAIQVAESDVLIFGEGRAKFDKQLIDSISGHAGHAASGADAVSFHEAGDNLTPLRYTGLVHYLNLSRLTLIVNRFLK